LLTLFIDNQVYSGVWSFCEIAIGIVAACLPTLAVLATKSHLTKIQASAIHLLSVTFRRSRGSNSSNIRSVHSVRETLPSESEYAHLSEESFARQNGGSRSGAAPFVTSRLAESGEKGEGKPSSVAENKVA
jgi:hypothetical protein